MNAHRFDLYTLVHKGQRKKLFELTTAVGRLAATDRAERARLATDVEQTLCAIEEHAHAEDEFLGPLYAEAAAPTGTRLAAEHVALDEAKRAVRTAVRVALEESTASADLGFYRALGSFTSKYLAHVDGEEHSLPELWARFDDAALARAQGAIIASHAPATVQFNLRNMLPAATSAERVGFLANLRRNLPPPAFAGLRASVEPFVSADEWSRIESA